MTIFAQLVIAGGMSSARKKTRRRGPSEGKTKETRRAIIAAATEVFLDQGFARARMTDIAAAAGVAKGLLYSYFDDKAALFKGVISELAQHPVRVLDSDPRRTDETVREFLLRSIVPMLEEFSSSQRAKLLRLVLAETSQFPVVGEIYLRNALEPLRASMGELARQALAAGELRSDALVRMPEILTLPALNAVIADLLLPNGRPPDSAVMFLAMVDAFFVEPITSNISRAKSDETR